MILKKVSMSNIDFKDVNSPKNIEYYTHDAFNIDVLSSNVNQYLKTEYTVSIAGQIKKVVGKTGIINDVMKKMVKIIPLDFNCLAMIDDHEELIDKLYKRLNSIEHRESCTVFIHRDFYKVARKLNIDNPVIYLNKLIKQSIKESMNKEWTRHSITSKVEDILLEVSTLTDTRCQVYMGSNRLSSLIALVFLDYLTISDFPIDDFTFHRELIFALSRDMFYKTKMENVLGILKKNRADLGPLMWMLMEILEKDKLNSNPLYMMEKIAHLGSDVGLDVTNAMRKLLFNNYMNPEAFDTKAYSENFEALGTTNQSIISQVTGLYLSNSPKTITSVDVPEDLRGSTVDNVDIKWAKDSLRTMNYKKVAKNIDKLEEARFDIKTEEDRKSLLETAKHIIIDIYDIQNADENKYPEMNVLLDKVQEVITEIENCPLGEEREDDLSTSGEGVITGAIGLGAKAVVGVVRLPGNIIRLIKSIPNPKELFKWNEDFENQRKNDGEYKDKGPMLATRFFMKVDEVMDKAIPSSFRVGPLSLNTDKMNNKRMLKKFKRQEKRRYMMNKVQDKWDSVGKESYIDTYMNYEPYYVGKEDAMDVMKSAGRGTKNAARATVKASKNAWRWIALKKAFREAMIAIKYISENNSVNSYEVKRIAMDHIKKWEALAEVMEEHAETEKMALSIRKELSKFKRKLIKRNIDVSKINEYETSEESYSEYIKDTTPGYESFVNGYESNMNEDDKKKYIDEQGRPFRDKLEDYMEDDDSEEKDEALEEFEDSILEKLKDKGAITEDEDEDVTKKGENFIDDFYDGKQDKDYLSKIKILEDKANKAKDKGNMKAYYNIKDKENLVRIREESKYYTSANKMYDKWKKDTFYLAFFSPHEFESRVIKFYENSPLSHVDIIYNGSTLHAMGETGEGLKELKLRGDHNLLIYELTNKVDKKKIIEFCEKTANSPFSIKPFIKGMVGINDKSNRYFCSKWVIEALDYATNYTLTYRGKKLKDCDYNKFTPQDVFSFAMQTNGILKNKSNKQFSDKK